MPSVLVIGAGLAGLAAALALARAKFSVTLCERRAFAGGRTYSLEGPDGEELDNGQHIFLHCCTAYRQFLRDIEAEHLVHVQPRAKVPFIDARTGRTSWIKAGLLPAPFHFLPSLLRFKPLTWAERRAAARCAKEMMRADRSALDAVSMGGWLRDHGQSAGAIARFWDIAILAVLNEHIDRVSAAAALFLFQEAFFGDRRAARVGYSRVGLGRIADRAVAAIRAAGGQVRFNSKVEELKGYDYFVPAVPARALLQLLPPEQRDSEFFARAADLPTSPIVNVHVKFDRPVWNRPFGAFLASPVQWLFNRNVMSGRTGGGSRLTISISGARELMEQKNEEIEQQYVTELRRLLPDARDAMVRRVTIVREPEATFVAAPGTKSKRLPCATPIPDLFLAGEWTESDWPSTMEAAVRSGVRAAEAVKRAAGSAR